MLWDLLAVVQTHKEIFILHIVKCPKEVKTYRNTNKGTWLIIKALFSIALVGVQAILVIDSSKN